MAGLEDIHRRLSDQEVKQAALMLLTAAAGDGPRGRELAAGDGRSLSHTDLASALIYVAGLFLDFAHQAEHHADASLVDFLQLEALAVAAGDTERSPSPPPIPDGITIADNAGAILAWVRVTADGRLDAGGDTSRWTEAAHAFIAELRRAAMNHPRPPGGS